MFLSITSILSVQGSAYAFPGLAKLQSAITLLAGSLFLADEQLFERGTMQHKIVAAY